MESLPAPDWGGKAFCLNKCMKYEPNNVSMGLVKQIGMKNNIERKAEPEGIERPRLEPRPNREGFLFSMKEILNY